MSRLNSKEVKALRELLLAIDRLLVIPRTESKVSVEEAERLKQACAVLRPRAYHREI
jgi:hypothetical protein